MQLDFTIPVDKIINIHQTQLKPNAEERRDNYIEELTAWMNDFIKLDIDELPLTENLNLTEYKKYPWFEKSLEDLLNSRTHDMQFSSEAVRAYVLDESMDSTDYFSNQADAVVFKHLLDTIAIAALVRLDNQGNTNSNAARELSYRIAAEVDGDSFMSSSNSSIAGNLHELINSNRKYEKGEFSLLDELINILYSKLSDEELSFTKRSDMASGIGCILPKGSVYQTLLMNANELVRNLENEKADDTYEVDEKMVLDMTILANLMPEDNSCELMELLELFNKITQHLEYKLGSELRKELYFIAEEAIENLEPEED